MALARTGLQCVLKSTSSLLSFEINPLLLSSAPMPYLWNGASLIGSLHFLLSQSRLTAENCRVLEFSGQ